MKNTLFYSVIMFCIITLSSCSNDKPDSTNHNHEHITTTYDSITANKYGADEYGMKKYVFAFLKKGPTRDMEEKTANALQMEHLKNIERLADEGKLVLAGPFFGNGDIRGIYIFNVSSIEAAKELTLSDPAIQAGSLEMELMEWYGSAALMNVNELHKTLAKKGITE